MLRQMLKETHIREQDISKLGILIYKLETEASDQSSDPLLRIKVNNKPYSGICCPFKNLFS